MRAIIALFIFVFSSNAFASVCSEMMESIENKSTLKVRVVFGYKDARPARFVGDRHERLAFISRVTAPCKENQDLCEFVRSPENADLFMKKIERPQGEQKFLLWIVNSSAGTDDVENRKDRFQSWRSRYSSQAFLSGLQDADVVLYNGHSRFGGGPDFEPPVMTPDGKVEPLAYQLERSGLERMIKALKGAKRSKNTRFSKLKLLGLYSCSSEQHFNSQIRQHFQGGLQASHELVYHSDALEQSVRTLESILSLRCPRQITFD